MTVHELRALLNEMPQGIEVKIRARRKHEGKAPVDNVEMWDDTCYIVAGAPEEF